MTLTGRTGPLDGCNTFNNFIPMFSLWIRFEFQQVENVARFRHQRASHAALESSTEMRCQQDDSIPATGSSTSHRTRSHSDSPCTAAPHADTDRHLATETAPKTALQSTGSFAYGPNADSGHAHPLVVQICILTTSIQIHLRTSLSLQNLNKLIHFLHNQQLIKRSVDCNWRWMPPIAAHRARLFSEKHWTLVTIRRTVCSVRKCSLIAPYRRRRRHPFISSTATRPTHFYLKKKSHYVIVTILKFHRTDRITLGHLVDKFINFESSSGQIFRTTFVQWIY